MKKQNLFRKAVPLISLIFWIGVWWGIALCLRKPLLLPTPWRVLCKLLSLAITADFWLAVGTSLLRVAGGILTALLIGTLLAFLSTRIKLLHHLFAPLLSLCKTTPVASVIFLLMLFMGRKNVPFFIAASIALPIVWANIREGLLCVDTQLLEMAHVFSLTPKRIFWHIRLPLLCPYFKAACLSAIGLAFKAGIAAEILCLPAGSIGALMYESKLYLQTEELFAYTLSVVLIGVAIERITLWLLTQTKREKEDGHHA